MSNSQTPPYPGFTPYVIPSAPTYQQSQFLGQQYPPGQQFPYPPSQLSPEHKYQSPSQEYDQQQQQKREYPSSSQKDLQGQEYSSASQQDPQEQQNPSSSQQHSQRHQYSSPSQQYPQGQSYFSPGYHYPYGQQYPSLSQQYPYGQFPSSAKNTPMIRPGRGSDPLDEQQVEGWEGFEDGKVRRVFVRKVYTILMLQLLVTMGIIALFVFEPNVKRFVRENKYLYYVALAVFAAIYIGLMCFQSLRRSYPINLIMLIIFTMAMAFMLGTISSFHRTDAVFMAVGICAAVCLVVTVFSFYTQFDFTSCGGILCILLLVLFFFGLIAILLPSKVMTMIYAGTGAVVFTILLAYNTQLLMGGKTYEFSPEEHIFVAIQLYMDIVLIFQYLLLLIGGSQ